MFKTAAGIAGDLLDFGWDVLGLVREVLRSRVGLILFLLHLALVSCAYATHGGPITSLLDTFGESLLMQVAVVVNVPMLLAAGLVTAAVFYERTAEEFGVLQWATVCLVLFCVLFQWWVYGYLIERIMSRRG